MMMFRPAPHRHPPSRAIRPPHAHRSRYRRCYGTGTHFQSNDSPGGRLQFRSGILDILGMVSTVRLCPDKIGMDMKRA